MKITQVKLSSGTTRLTCWVENRVKPGDSITLKNTDDPDRLWNVLTVSEPREHDTVNRGWNNNI